MTYDWGDRTKRAYGRKALPKVYTEADMEAERQACARLAKVFWLDYPLDHIMDADVVCGLCEGIAAAILARGEPENDQAAQPQT